MYLFYRGDRIRTCDLRDPNAALYQAEPRPDNEQYAIMASTFMQRLTRATAGFVVGIDAGGTRVRVALADARGGAVVAEDQAPALPDGGPGSAVSVLAGILTGMPPCSPCLAVCAGIAKATRAGVMGAWERELKALLPDAVFVGVPDYQIAYHAAIVGETGVLVVAGTGSVSYAERGGATVRVGGRGWDYGDEGSGAWLTTDLVRRTLRALDGLGPASTLTTSVCDELGARQPSALAEAARARSQSEGRGFLVPLALARAKAGDSEAVDLFVGAAGWLALLARTAAHRLEFSKEAIFPVATAGGIWNAGDLVRLPFDVVLRRSFPHMFLQRGTATPVQGAVRLARRALGHGGVSD